MVWCGNVNVSCYMGMWRDFRLYTVLCCRVAISPTLRLSSRPTHSEFKVGAEGMLFVHDVWLSLLFELHTVTTHQRVCKVQSGMSGLPVAVRAGTSLYLVDDCCLMYDRTRHSLVSWHFDLLGAASTQQLWRQHFRSRWTSLVELSSGPAAQSGPQVRTVQTTADESPFSGNMNPPLCDFWYAAPQKTLF